MSKSRKPTLFNQPNQHVGQQFNVAGPAEINVSAHPSPPPAGVKGAGKRSAPARASGTAKKKSPTPRAETKPQLRSGPKDSDTSPVGEGKNGLTWLHLSDWHQRGRDFDRGVVRDALLRDLRQRAAIAPALAKVDFVIFSGDAAFSGTAEEFQSARKELFEPVLKELDLPANRLFFVPGNHDLSRAHVEEFLPPALRKPLEDDSQVQKWLTDEKRRKSVLSPFEDYASFVTDYTGQTAPAYANTWTEVICGKRVAILGLNSAWMCGRKKERNGEVNDYGFLTLGEPQLHAALSTIQEADVRLAVLHHPFDWLARFDRNRVESRLKKSCHFVLHGHEHQPDFNLASGLTGECAVIPAGACYDRRMAADSRYTNAYNFVRLDFETGRGIIYLRRWSDRRNEWIKDNESHDDGQFEFRLPRELGSGETFVPPSTPSPGNDKEKKPNANAQAVYAFVGQRTRAVLESNPQLRADLEQALASPASNSARAAGDIVEVFFNAELEDVFDAIYQLLNQAGRRDDYPAIRELLDGLPALGVDAGWVARERERLAGNKGAPQGGRVAVPRTTEMATAEVLKSALRDGPAYWSRNAGSPLPSGQGGFDATVEPRSPTLPARLKEFRDYLLNQCAVPDDRDAQKKLEEHLEARWRQRKPLYGLFPETDPLPQAMVQDRTIPWHFLFVMQQDSNMSDVLKKPRGVAVWLNEILSQLDRMAPAGASY